MPPVQCGDDRRESYTYRHSRMVTANMVQVRQGTIVFESIMEAMRNTERRERLNRQSTTPSKPCIIGTGRSQIAGRG